MKKFISFYLLTSFPPSLVFSSTNESGNNQKTYQILGASETNPRQGIISHHSPLGAALMGRKVGEIVKIRLANKEVEYRIIKIE